MGRTRLIAVAMSAAIATPAAAQDATADARRERQAPDAADGDVVVTGTITRAGVGLLGNKAIIDTPFAVSGITDDLIRDQFVRTVKDAVAFDPSVRQGNAPGTQFEQFTIRGLPLLAVETSFNGLYGLVGGRRANLAGAERVEIFKGPNALLNGISPFGALGGTINIVPKRARLGQDQIGELSFTGRSTIGFASIGTRTADEAFGVQVGTQIADGNTPIRTNELFDFTVNVAADYRAGGLAVTIDAGHDYSEYQAPESLLGVAAGVAIPRAPMLTVSLSQRYANYRVEGQRAVLGLRYDSVAIGRYPAGSAAGAPSRPTISRQACGSTRPTAISASSASPAAARTSRLWATSV